MIKLCAECGQPITNRVPQAKMCSDECVRAADKKRHARRKGAIKAMRTQPRLCKRFGCHVTFTPSHGGQKYCSVACRRRNNIQSAPAQMRSVFKRILRRHGLAS